MKTTISALIRPYRSVSIIGMCKNAGKTTVLNQLIRELNGNGQTLALTSIGRDGEDKDLVTGTQKPGIYVARGTLIATASDLILRHCDVTREILATTGISTRLNNRASKSSPKLSCCKPSTYVNHSLLRRNLSGTSPSAKNARNCASSSNEFSPSQ